MKYGYLLRQWAEEGLAISIRIDLSTHPHMLLTGSSGSGKSYALIYLLGMLAKDGTIKIRFCDFKNSEDFKFLSAYGRYYYGDCVYDGIMTFYKDFCTARKEGILGRRHLLIVDEYPALISYLTMRDKEGKTKRAVEVQSAIAEILMLGRGLGFGVWINTQRADSYLFEHGSRDNFMVICGLGRLSKEQRQMLFSSEEIPTDTIYDKGEGLLLADGKELVEVKFPLISDIDEWKAHIRQSLISLDEQIDV